MAWVRTTPPSAATGLLKQVYDAAVRRAGKVYNILRLQSARPRVLDASTRLYLEVMHSDSSGLTRARREMIATTVSRINHCYYWTRAHGEDLRAEVQGQEGADALVEALMTDYRRADLPPGDRGMLEFVEKLTREPSAMRADDVASLRSLGFDDAAIHDIVQVAALFNYFDRLADGLGIDPEPEWGERSSHW